MMWVAVASFSGFAVELVALAAALVVQEKRLSRRVVSLVVAFSLFRLLGEFIKTGVAAARPCWDPGVLALIDCPDSLSFPSGHALGAAMVAVIVGLVYRRGFVWFIGLVAALLVGVSRVMVFVHSWQDVVAGGLLGAIFGFVAWRVFWRDR